MARLVSVKDMHSGFQWLYIILSSDNPPIHHGTNMAAWPHWAIFPDGMFVWDESDGLFTFGFKSNGMQTGHGGLWSSRASILGTCIGEPCIDVSLAICSGSSLGGLAIRAKDLAPMLPESYVIVPNDTEPFGAYVMFKEAPQGAYLCTL